MTLSLDKCKGCGAVGLVERGEYPLCGRCLPNAYAIHLAEEASKRMQRATPSPYDCGGNPTKDYPGE